MIRLAEPSHFHLRVGRATVRAEAVRGRAVVWAGEAHYASASELAEVVARLAAEGPPACRRANVALERPPVQLRTLTDLPRVKQRELRALVAHQALRFFRRNGAPLVTDAAWIRQGAVPAARAAAVAEPLVEAITAGARSAGLTVDRIAPADEPAPLDLLPLSERVRLKRAIRNVVRRLGIATGAVWLTLAGLAVARIVMERRTVEHELAVLAAPLAAVVAARRELHDANATLDAVASAEALRTRPLAMLAAVTRVLPDSAVLTSLTWSEDGSGAMSGTAHRAAAVVAGLDSSGAVAAPRLEGPVVRELRAGGDWERFRIVFGRTGHTRRDNGP